MLRAFLAVVIATVAATAAAVPPYEPLPSSQSGNSTSNRSGSSSSAVSDNSGGFNYSAAESGSSQSGVGTTSMSWDAMSQIQQLQQEVLQLRGMVEELNHQIDVMQKQERERYLDLDMRINQIQSGAGPIKQSGSAVSSLAVGDDKALYERASKLRKDGKYPEAIAVLQQLLAQSPKGVYAPYSEYWLGELYMVAEPVDLDKAKRHFVNLLANHPDHVKVPDAMYKLGKLYASKGETSKAKSTLSALVKQYPDKSAARLADDLLKTL